jgi:hypothetical protein
MGIIKEQVDLGLVSEGYEETQSLSVQGKVVVSEHRQINFQTLTGNEYILTRRDDGGYSMLNVRLSTTRQFTRHEAEELVIEEGRRFEYAKEGRTTVVNFVYTFDE